jgi:hypothetical protein
VFQYIQQHFVDWLHQKYDASVAKTSLVIILTVKGKCVTRKVCLALNLLVRIDLMFSL